MMTADPDSTNNVMSRAVRNEATPDDMSGTEMVALNAIRGGGKSRKKGMNKQSVREGTRVMKMIALLALSILTVAAALTWMQFHQAKTLVNKDEISGGDASASSHISDKNTVEAVPEDGSAATRNPATDSPQQVKKPVETKAPEVPAGQPVDQKQKQQSTQQTTKNPKQKGHGPSKPKDGELEDATAQPEPAQSTETKPNQPGTGAQRIPFPESNQKPPVTNKQDLDNEIIGKPNINSNGQAPQVTAISPANVTVLPVPENMPQEPKVLNKWNEKQMKMTGKRNDDQSGKILKDDQAKEEERKYKNSPPSQARGNPRPLQPNLDGKPQKLGMGISETVVPTAGQSLGNPSPLQPNRNGNTEKIGMGRKTIAPTAGQSRGNTRPLQPSRDGTTQKIGMNAAGASNKASVNGGMMKKKRNGMMMMMNRNKNVPEATGMVWKQKPNAPEELIPEQQSLAPANGEPVTTSMVWKQNKPNAGQAPEEVLPEQPSTTPANGFFKPFWNFASSIAPGIPVQTQEGGPESPQQEQQGAPLAFRKQPVERPAVNTNTTNTKKNNSN